jgi:YD repeat-containing protein
MTPADILTAVSGITGSTWNIFYEQNFWGATTIGGVRVNEISQTQGSVTLSKTYKYIYQNNNQSAEIISNAYTQIGWLINGVNLFLSGSPFTLNDINGNFVGYSSVKETEQNGGYTFYSFSNFNDGADPDGLTNSDVFNVTSSQTGASFQFISPSESLSYKRGLLTNKSVYNANGNLISQTSYNYLPQNTSLSTTPLTYKGYGFQTIPINATINGGGGAYVLSIIFSTPIENYRLTQAVQNDYDQVTPSNLVTTTTNYTYEQQPTDLINNYRLINNISIIDSKNLTRTQTIYHSEDVINSSAIPMVTASEKQAIQAMVNSNNTDAVIHTIDNNNSTMTLTHNSYVLPLYGLNNNIYLGNTATYTSDPANTTNTLVKQQFYNFDAATSNLISSNATANKSTAIAYGYNSSYPIAKTVNAGSTISYAQQPLSQTGAINVPPNTFAPLTTTFTTYYSGTITIAMPQGSYLATSVTCYFSFTLSGPSNGSGNLCNSSVSGYTCTPPNTVSFSNMPAGTYTLTVTALTNTAASIVPVNFTYTGEQFVSSPTNEYFFEGFEEKTGATSGFSHTGNMYWNTSYTVPYTPPNSRSYILQYWSFSGVTWNFKQVYPYTTGTILAGPVDDIRIFPSDALMTTYTYNPLVGKTSETDPSGRSTIYQYDGLNRLQTIRDQDNNILKQYDYEYQQLAAPVTNVVESGSFQRSCSSGYIGSFVTYTVPAGKYSSYISQQDANQQAINDVNTNGPAFANNPANGGTCMVAETVTYTDSRTFQYSVRFTNNSTGIMYNYTSNANSSGTFGQVPSGVYTVYICPIGNYTANNNYTVFGSSQSNVVCATFNNVSVTANGSINFY